MSELANIPEAEVLPANPMISMIERVAMDPNADLSKLERMLELKQQHEADVARSAFSAAFAKASAEFPSIPLNGTGHNNTRYATLKDITSLTRPVLSAHGLALTFSVEVGDQVVVTAELMHKDGHSKSTSIALPRDSSGAKNAPQAVGSSQTYGQRYAAQAILGLSLGDDTEDDGAGASAPERITEQQYRDLSKLIELSGIDESVVCTAEKIEILAELPSTRFSHVYDKLQKTVKKQSAQRHD